MAGLNFFLTHRQSPKQAIIAFHHVAENKIEPSRISF